MKWSVKVVTEESSGKLVEHEVATIERDDLISAAQAGLTIADGKAIMEALQKRCRASGLIKHSVRAN
jgi:hypothetical protein